MPLCYFIFLIIYFYCILQRNTMQWIGGRGGNPLYFEECGPEGNAISG